MNSSQIIIFSVIAFLLLGIIFSCNGKKNINEAFQETRQETQQERHQRFITNLRRTESQSKRIFSAAMGKESSNSSLRTNAYQQNYRTTHINRGGNNSVQKSNIVNDTNHKILENIIQNLGKQDINSGSQVSNLEKKNIIAKNIQLIIEQNIPENYTNIPLKNIIDITINNILQQIPEEKKTELVGNLSRQIVGEIINYVYTNSDNRNLTVEDLLRAAISRIPQNIKELTPEQLLQMAVQENIPENIKGKTLEQLVNETKNNIIQNFPNNILEMVPNELTKQLSQQIANEMVKSYNLEFVNNNTKQNEEQSINHGTVFGGDYLNGSDNNWNRAGYSGNQNISPTSHSTPSIVYNNQQKYRPINGIKIVDPEIELSNNVEAYPQIYKDQETKTFHYYDQESKIMTEIEYPTTTPDMTVSEAETILQKHKFSKKQIDKVKNMLNEDVCAETETAKQLRNALGKDYSICKSTQQSIEKAIETPWYSAIGTNATLSKYKTTILVLTILIVIVVIIIIYMLYIRNSGNNNSNYPSFNNSNRTNVIRNNIVRNNLKFQSRFNTK